MSFEDYTYRSLSTAAKASLAAQETGEVWLMLLALSNPYFTSTFRYVDNSEAITSNGDTYQSFPFEITLPNEDGESVQRARLSLYAHPDIIEAVRSLRGQLTVEISVIMASEPDTIVTGPISLVLLDIEWDALTVNGTLGSSIKLLDEPTPSDRFNPGSYPTLF